MPGITVNGVELYYEDSGDGPETIFFAHGILMSGRMFDEQVAALKGTYRCLTYDSRGHGRSEAPAAGYDMDKLYLDDCALIEELDCAPCHYVGFSMGGFKGLRVAARRPELVRSLTLIDTGAAAETTLNRIKYRFLDIIQRRVSLGLAADQAMKVLFGPEFLSGDEFAEQRTFWRENILGMDKQAISRIVTGLNNRRSVTSELGNIQASTLIVVGEEDVAIKPEYSQQMLEGIPDARLVTIPGCGHTTPVEAPADVNQALSDFLNA